MVMADDERRKAATEAAAEPIADELCRLGEQLAASRARTIAERAIAAYDAALGGAEGHDDTHNVGQLALALGDWETQTLDEVARDMAPERAAGVWAISLQRRCKQGRVIKVRKALHELESAFSIRQDGGSGKTLYLGDEESVRLHIGDPGELTFVCWMADVGWDRENYALKREFVAESGLEGWWEQTSAPSDGKETKKLRRAWRFEYEAASNA
jgi:hypothetical protein